MSSCQRSITSWVSSGTLLFEVADGVDVTQDLHALAFQLAHAMVKRAGELLAVVDALCFLDLCEREAEELEGEDAIEALFVVSRIEALVLLAFGTGVQQALLIVVLDGAHGHAHAPGEFANSHQIIFVCRHAVLLSHAESQSSLAAYYRARRYVTVKCPCGDCRCFAATRWCRLNLAPTLGLGSMILKRSSLFAARHIRQDGVVFLRGHATQKSRMPPCLKIKLRE